MPSFQAYLAAAPDFKTAGVVSLCTILSLDFFFFLKISVHMLAFQRYIGGAHVCPDISFETRAGTGLSLDFFFLKIGWFMARNRKLFWFWEPNQVFLT